MMLGALAASLQVWRTNGTVFSLQMIVYAQVAPFMEGHLQIPQFDRRTCST